MLPVHHQIPDADLDDFIAIYKDEFGEGITRADASEMASRLVMLYVLLSRKLPEQKRASLVVTQQDEDYPRIGFQV